MIDKSENDKCINVDKQREVEEEIMPTRGKKEGSKKGKTILDHLIPRPRAESEGAIDIIYKRRREEKDRIEAELLRKGTFRKIRKTKENRKISIRK